MNTEIAELVMKLHDISRYFEQAHGINEVTKELRKCADHIHEIGVNLDREEHKDKQ